ncbi:DUF1294 domain-containing protein [Marinomonas pollencensis]|uniref:Uncharacterized membrane protein YsdA (DUF1294 family) n=1 Tax=Marinomonas pollencensis TaxID=491954 RepID=A0A3E0DHW8_9GAMM|nr:DUF1294 domain-containing protein [Marinomonas pollencensis]REG82185.1 uncharacterized membrane protein YsdA (DUF1294 family) [Marinomonas pollencensis]
MSLSIILFIYYLLISLLTFALYGWDKGAAKRQAYRIPESRLHWFALLGGWPGALLGQKYYRHKTLKTRFRLVFWSTLVINLMLFSLGCFLAVRGVQGMNAILSWF